ncbi:MAG: efflux RND transporter permease subunit [Hymenobacter sp.]
MERTYAIAEDLQHLAKDVPGIQSISTLAGYEVLTEGRGSNAGTCLINLKPWSERKESIHDVIESLEKKAKEIPGATIEFFEPPAVPGYGAAGGFQLADAGQNQHRRLQSAGTGEQRLYGRPAQTPGAGRPLHLL